MQSAVPALRRPDLSRILWKPAGWFALAYCGYWLATVLEDLVVPVVIAPLAGAPLGGWRLTAFGAAAVSRDLPASHSLAAFLFVLPLLLEICFLVGLVVLGGRIRSGALAVATHFSGIWVVIFSALHLFRFAAGARGRLGRVLALLLGRPSESAILRGIVVVAASLLLIAAGRVLTSRLLASAGTDWLPERKRWLAALFLAAPLLLISVPAFNGINWIRYAGALGFAYALVPVAVTLLLVFVSLLRKSQLELSPALTGRGAIAAICGASLLFGGLQQSQPVRRWAVQLRLDHVRTAHYDILYNPRSFARPSVEQLAAAHEALLTTLAARIHAPLEGLRLRIVLYPNLPAKNAGVGNIRPYTVEGTTIHAVLEGWVTNVDPAADATALLASAWGRPGTGRMQNWIARWLAGTWQGASLLPASVQIERDIGHYTLAEMVESSSDGWFSPLTREPLGGAWVEWVENQWGPGALRTLYRAKPADMNPAALAAALGTTPEALEAGWKHWMGEQASQIASDPPEHRTLGNGFFLRGVSFSHEGWSGAGGGYASVEGAEQLRLLHAMGANAIALVPYGFVRNASGAPVSYTGTDESDEQLSQAAFVAHQLGMKVMLKPQLWVSRAGFTGNIRIDDPARRAAWMRGYREFILHYAELAELRRFDLLCIGNELEGLTTHTGEWRRLIADIRRVYHGPLTYAANWGSEVESVRFWNALDYIGVNNYYPLAATTGPASSDSGVAPRPDDLLPAADRLAMHFRDLSRKWGRPILFTEVGYPSVRGGAREPWIEGAGRPVSLPEQAAAYEATFRAFVGRPWFQGMFWWKWPSSGRGGGPESASYTPLGKPAAQVLSDWFTRLAKSRSSSPAGAP